MDILEPQIRALYKILGHSECDGVSDMRCIIPGGSPLEQDKEFQDKLANFRKRNNREPDDKEMQTLHVVSRMLIKGESEVIKWARTYNGRGNCYIGRTARKANGELQEFRTITADIDPDREKGSAATTDQSILAFKAAKSVLAQFKGGYIANSGNGALIVYRLPCPVNTEFKTFETKFRLFEDEMRKFVPQGSTLDATFDTARMVKLLGTVSTKGPKSDWRHSRFVDFPMLPYATNTVLDRINSCAPVVKSVPIALKNTVYASKSESDFALAVHYKKAGLDKETTRLALQNHVLGRKTDYKDQDRILYKVFDLGESQEKMVTGKEVTELQYSTPGDKLNEHKERLLNKKNFPAPEMSLGLTLIDRHTWGLRRGEIFTIAARPAIGKTSIAASIAIRMARTGKRVLYFTSEMSVDSTYDRLLQVLSGISGDKFNTGNFTDEDKPRLDAAYDELRGFGERFTICDACSPDIFQVNKLAFKVMPDLLIYDHIQHIGGASDSARDNVSKFVKGLKDVSREINCAVLMLSQIRRLYRDPKTGKEIRPTLSDLKESGTIEEESAAVLLLSILSEDPESSIRCLYSELAKNRFGPIATVGVEFDKFTANFKDMEAGALT